MLGDCVGERLNLEVVLGMCHANWLKSPVLTVKCLCGVFLMEKMAAQVNLDTEHRGFITFLVVDCVCYRSVALGEVAFGEKYGLEFFRGTWLPM